MVRTGVPAVEAGCSYGAGLRSRSGGDALVLRTCPFENAAVADRATACAIRLGIAKGITEGTSVAVDELVANDPRVADCRLRVREDAAGGDGQLTIRGRRSTYSGS